MFKKLLIFSLLFSNLFASNIKVALAANMALAFKQIKTQFNKIYPNINIISTISSSGQLATQIQNGANYEIFISADLIYPNALKKFALSDVKTYAKGGLTLSSTKYFDTKKGLNILKDKSIKKISIANPKTAPYGKASMQVLKKLNLYDDIKHKLVFAPNISSALSYVLKATDIGIVATSSLIDLKTKLYSVNINSTLHKPLTQGVILLKNSSAEAKLFFDFFLSNKTQHILKQYGYNL